MQTVIATFKVIGFHAWPGAPDDVRYLRDQHRHEFRLRVEVDTNDPNREVEFHMLARHSRSLMDDLFRCNMHGEFLFDARSCEMIADALGQALIGKSVKVVAVECWEDEENGARVTYQWRQP